MDKETVVHIYNGILLSHKKEHMWDSSNEEDESREYCTDWSKSEKEASVLYCIGPERKCNPSNHLHLKQQQQQRDQPAL